MINIIVIKEFINFNRCADISVIRRPNDLIINHISEKSEFMSLRSTNQNLYLFIEKRRCVQRFRSLANKNKTENTESPKLETSRYQK